MRIASLQPSVTLTLAALGRLDLLCAHTKYCLEALPSLAGLNLPIVSDSWTTNSEELHAIDPSLVIASVPYRIESFVKILKAGFPLLALAPNSLEDVADDMRLIARQVDRLSEAELLIEEFQRALAARRDATRNLERVTVYCEEWGKPPIHSQRWIAELIDANGGTFVGKPGDQTTPEAIADTDPDVLIFAWCGAGNRVPLRRVIAQRNWSHLRAVRSRRVYCIPDEYLNTPAISSLAQGLAHIATAIHPERSTGGQLITLPTE